MESKHVPFLDLKAQYHTIKEEVGQAIDEVLSSAQYILGPKIKAFEEQFAAAHNSKYCITVSNGTAALHLALWAHNIGAGDEVIVPTNTFIATAEGVVLCGATPVFVDHDEYYNIEISQVEEAITARTKAVIAVHLYGQPAKMKELKALCDKYNLILIEDAAQAHLATYDNQFIGSWGAATCFSFYPGKNLGAYGEGGAILTNDEGLAYRMRLLRDHGSESKYNHVVSGHNYRLEALQGAILSVKLKYLPHWTSNRRAAAKLYTSLLSEISEIQCPQVHPNTDPVWHLYVIQARDREKLKDYLTEKGIGTGLHYPIPLHQQPCFKDVVDKSSSYENAERCAPRLLSLPMFPELAEEQIRYVATSIKEFYSQR